MYNASTSLYYHQQIMSSSIYFHFQSSTFFSFFAVLFVYIPFASILNTYKYSVVKCAATNQNPTQRSLKFDNAFSRKKYPIHYFWAHIPTIWHSTIILHILEANSLHVMSRIKDILSHKSTSKPLLASMNISQKTAEVKSSLRHSHYSNTHSINTKVTLIHSATIIAQKYTHCFISTPIL